MGACQAQPKKRQKKNESKSHDVSAYQSPRSHDIESKPESRQISKPESKLDSKQEIQHHDSGLNSIDNPPMKSIADQVNSSRHHRSYSQQRFKKLHEQIENIEHEIQKSQSNSPMSRQDELSVGSRRDSVGRRDLPVNEPGRVQKKSKFNQNQEEKVQTFELKKGNINKQYELNECILTSHYYDQYKAYNITQDTHRLVDRYRLKLITKEQKESFLEKLGYIHRAKSQKLLLLVEAFEDDTEMFIVWDYCEGGTLVQKLNQLIHWSEQEIRSILSQLLESLSILHSFGFVHGNICPQNIYFDYTGQSTSNLRLGGITIDWPGDVHLGQVIKNDLIFFIPPESILNHEFCVLGDIWSIGILAYYLQTGHYIFKGQDKKSTGTLILSGQFHTHSPEWDQMSQSLKKLIQTILMINKNSRPTLQRLLENEWITNHIRAINTEKSHREALQSFKHNYNLHNLQVGLIQYIQHMQLLQVNKKTALEKFKEKDPDNKQELSKVLVTKYLNTIFHIHQKIDEDKGYINYHDALNYIMETQTKYCEKTFQKILSESIRARAQQVDKQVFVQLFQELLFYDPSLKSLVAAIERSQGTKMEYDTLFEILKHRFVN